MNHQGIGGRLPVLVAAASEPWEAQALDLLARSSVTDVHKRCVDLQDLVATARTGLARVALVSGRLPGLDADTVATLERAGVGLVAVLADPDEALGARLQRLGVRREVGADLDGLVDLLLEVGTDAEPERPIEDDSVTRPAPVPGQAGRITAVWGPTGAPGRTTVATGLAAELAHRGSEAFLLDADPYGGAVAQHLGILDEVSGLLSAARSANAGRLDRLVLAGAARRVADHLRVLTGLPRPDRWAEVRSAAFEELLDGAAEISEQVVIDVGFSLEHDGHDPFGGLPQRNGMTLSALERADDVVVVGSADPVGLARLARGLVDLQNAFPAAQVHVVVNRNRPTLGWSEVDVRGMVEGFLRPASVTFLPDDRAAVDRSLVAGRSLVESGESALRRGIAELADALRGEQAVPQQPGVRRRRQEPKSR